MSTRAFTKEIWKAVVILVLTFRGEGKSLMDVEFFYKRNMYVKSDFLV